MTKVINIYRAPYGWENDSLYVYIGRSGRGFDGFFGNPIKIGEICPVCNKIHTKNGDTLKCFEYYVVDRFRNDVVYNYGVKSLKDKILVCFCKPKPCHGDIYIKLLDGIY